MPLTTIEPPQPPLRMRIKPPIEFDGKTYSELIFDFGGLTAQDFDRADRTLLKKKSAERDVNTFTAVLAAQVANVPAGLILKLPARYYRAIRAELLEAYALRRRRKRLER